MKSKCCTPVGTVSDEIKRQHDELDDVESQLGFSSTVYNKLEELDRILRKPSEVTTVWDIMLQCIPGVARDHLLTILRPRMFKTFKPSRIVLFIEDLDRCNKDFALKLFRTCNALISEELQSFLPLN